MVKRDRSLPYTVEFRWTLDKDTFIHGLFSAGFEIRPRDVYPSSRVGEFDHIFIIFQSKDHGLRAMEALNHLKVPPHEKWFWAYGATGSAQLRDHADGRDPKNLIPTIEGIQEAMRAAFQTLIDRTTPKVFRPDWSWFLKPGEEPSFEYGRGIVRRVDHPGKNKYYNVPRGQTLAFMASIWDNTQWFDRVRAHIRNELTVGPPRVDYTPRDWQQAHPGQPFPCDLRKRPYPPHRIIADWNVGLYMRAADGRLTCPRMEMLISAWRMIVAGDRRILRIGSPTHHHISHLCHNRVNLSRAARIIPQLLMKMLVVCPPTAPNCRKQNR